MTGVAVVGVGAIGRRVAAAVDLQPDMHLVGLAIGRPGPYVLAAARAGMNLFSGPSADLQNLSKAGISVHGDLEDLVRVADVVVDCGPRGTGASRSQTYREHGCRAVFCGGESNEIGIPYSPLASHALAFGTSAAKVVSCNTTALVRVSSAFRAASTVLDAHALIVRAATDVDKAYKGRPGEVVMSPLPSHHASDVRSLWPDMPFTSAAVTAPTHLGHIAHLTFWTETEVDAMTELAQVQRLVVTMDEHDLSGRTLRNRYGINGDLHAVVALGSSVQKQGSRISFTAFLHPEAIVVPDTIDCIRAVAELEHDAEVSMKITDDALRTVSRSQESY